MGVGTYEPGALLVTQVEAVRGVSAFSFFAFFGGKGKSVENFWESMLCITWLVVGISVVVIGRTSDYRCLLFICSGGAA